MEVDDASSRRPLAVAAGVDIGSAIVASMAVSPFILAIDRAIIEAASGTKALFPGIASSTLEMVERPQRALLFNPAYWMVAGVYAVTYAVANGIDTLCDRYKASAVHGAVTLLGRRHPTQRHALPRTLLSRACTARPPRLVGAFRSPQFRSLDYAI